MPISEEWTDPDTLEQSLGEARFEDFNAVLGNQKYLYAGPRVTLVRNSPWVAETGADTLISWTSALVDNEGWWDPGSPTVAVVPRDGVYLVSMRLLWPNESGGSFRRWRLLRDGNPVGGGRVAVTNFAEHADTIQTAVRAGDALSVDMRHDAGSDLTVPHDQTPVWRSPILQAHWSAPLDGSQ